MSKKPHELCVYCITRHGVTRDHAVPKCLFTHLPVEMVTVPACFQCNGEKGNDDIYLRDMLAITVENSKHPVAREILKTKMIRAARRNRSQIARDMRSKGGLSPMYSKGGIYLGTYPSVPLDGPRINRIFARITRGLYYKIMKKHLPKETVFTVQGIRPMDVPDTIQTTIAMKAQGPRVLGNVFACWFTYAAEDDSVSYWLQRYYNFYITVFTNMSKIPPDSCVPEHHEKLLEVEPFLD